MVRRLKSELPPRLRRHPTLPQAGAGALEVDYPTRRSAQAHAALRGYTEAAQSRAPPDHAEQFATDFVLKMLKKRLFSSPAAFLRTLEKHANRSNAGRRTAAARCRSRCSPPVRRKSSPLRERRRVRGGGGRRPRGGSTRPKRAVLRGAGAAGALERWAERAATKPDAKTEAVLALIEETCRPGGAWTDERVILFTEYRATQNWLLDVLAAAGSPAATAAHAVRRHGPRSERGSRRPSRPTHASRPSASCWRPTPPPRASTSRTTATGSSTTRSRGTRTGSSSATGASTATANAPRRCSSTTSRQGLQRPPAPARLPAGDLDADLEFLARWP